MRCILECPDMCGLSGKMLDAAHERGFPLAVTAVLRAQAYPVSRGVMGLEEGLFSSIAECNPFDVILIIDLIDKKGLI